MITAIQKEFVTKLSARVKHFNFVDLDMDDVSQL